MQSKEVLEQRSGATFSTSDRADNGWFSRTSGAVNACKPWLETFSSVNDTLPDGRRSRDQGDMMKPRAVESAVFGRKKTYTSHNYNE